MHRSRDNRALEWHRPPNPLVSFLLTCKNETHDNTPEVNERLTGISFPSLSLTGDILNTWSIEEIEFQREFSAIWRPAQMLQSGVRNNFAMTRNFSGVIPSSKTKLCYWISNLSVEKTLGIKLVNRWSINIFVMQYRPEKYSFIYVYRLRKWAIPDIFKYDTSSRNKILSVYWMKY